MQGRVAGGHGCARACARSHPGPPPVIPPIPSPGSKSAVLIFVPWPAVLSDCDRVWFGRTLSGFGACKLACMRPSMRALWPRVLFCGHAVATLEPDEGATERALLDDDPGRTQPDTGVLSHLVSQSGPTLVSVRHRIVTGQDIVHGIASPFASLHTASRLRTGWHIDCTHGCRWCKPG